MTGGAGIGGNIILLHKDASPDQSCYEYPDAGTSICSDVITIPINNDQPVRNITIANLWWMAFCEVEVFAGKRLYFYALKKNKNKNTTLVL